MTKSPGRNGKEIVKVPGGPLRTLVTRVEVTATVEQLTRRVELRRVELELTWSELGKRLGVTRQRASTLCKTTQLTEAAFKRLTAALEWTLEDWHQPLLGTSLERTDGSDVIRQGAKRIAAKVLATSGVAR